ncbi:hypothetical protein D3C81_1409920 [compost metagenome]
MTSGVRRMPPTGSALPGRSSTVPTMPSGPAITLALNCLAGSTSRVKAGVKNMTAGRWVASVLAITSLANELFSNSVTKFSPALRSR